MAKLRRASFDSPDEVRRLPEMAATLVKVGSTSLGRARMEPGWHWTTHVKPRVGTDLCEIHHLQIMLSGRLGIRMKDGEEIELGPGDVCEIPPGHDAWVIGDEACFVIDVFGNVGSFGLPTSPDRVLATLLLTDIVDSTATASRLGDAAWRQLLNNHNRVVRTELGHYRGNEVHTTGDGFLATFTSPVAALRCALAIRDATTAIGVEVRIGINTGEIEVLPDDIGGIAVHVTARIMALGGASEIVVSAATQGLADGKGLQFEDAGSHQVKGVESPVHVYRLEG